jgi:cell volume regulation protein A
MPESVTLEFILLGAGAMLILSILASKASTKLGIPALVLFIGLGMLLGSEGPGGLEFDSPSLARMIGTIALALILFAGGLDTKWSHVKPVLFTGLSLATVGVFVTGGLIGLTACWLMNFPPVIGFLLGAILSSTDAAAVFGVLKARKIYVKEGLAPLLELESGSNDPMAVFLTMTLTSLALKPGQPLLPLVPTFFIQMAVGALVGIALGTVAAKLINWLRLDSGGLYPAITIGICFLSFGGAEELHGNAFLSVYLCGLALGNRRFLNRQSLIAFHDGVAWLMQIAVFVMLGLLVFPSRLLPHAGPSLLLSFVLVAIARPAAVMLSTLGSRWMTMRDRLFVSWTGLRGAVPIILATIPLMEGVPQSETLFNIVFFAVLTSVMVQGTLIGHVADWLGVRVPGSTSVEHQRQHSGQVTLRDDSPAAGKFVLDLDLPRWALLLLVQRGNEDFVPQGSTQLLAGDIVFLATRKEDLEDLSRQLAG